MATVAPRDSPYPGSTRGDVGTKLVEGEVVAVEDVVWVAEREVVAVMVAVCVGDMVTVAVAVADTVGVREEVALTVGEREEQFLGDSR